MNISPVNIMSIIKEEVLPGLIEDLGRIANSCAQHEKGGKIGLDISIKVKGGRLNIAAVVKSKKPLSARKDESEKSSPVELASIDLSEDEGQEKLPGVES
jgi:hypothetical protein